MADVRRTITYTGDAARVSALVQMLEQEGVTVEWMPPREQRGLGGDLNEIVVNLTSTGSALAIAAAVKKFRARFPHHKADVEGENGGEPDADAGE